MVKPATDPDRDVVLDVSHLTVSFRTEDGPLTAVDDVSLRVRAGETMALVGESGSGKSVTSLAVMRLVEHGGGTIAGGSIRLRDRRGQLRDLIGCDGRSLRQLRGSDMAMIFQEPMTSLNPVFQAGEQIAESLMLHSETINPTVPAGEQIAEVLTGPRRMNAAVAREEVLRLLSLVRIPDASSVAARFPHQLSGGMRQRVMIAMALACRPSLLIADEPTTALDVTVQAQVLALIRSLQKDIDMGVLFITHDMGVVAEIADRVCVMRYGKIVEEGECREIFARPRHPYTRSLLAAVPRLGAMNGQDRPRRFDLLDAEGGPAAQASDGPVSEPGDTILSVRHLYKRFPARRDFFGRVTHQVYACEDVSFDLRRGETLSIVGESGCGKSTTGRAVLRLFAPDRGEVLYGGRDLTALSGREMKRHRRHLQMIFQDPYASLDPRLTVGYSIAEPLFIHGLRDRQRAERRVSELLELVGLSPTMRNRYPHEFSGGQRQRVCIARALALEPEIIVADESVAALDVSIRAQVINLLLDLQRELGLSYIFISHDMGVVERVSHRVMVMYLGQVVELGSRRQVFENPLHPYTRKLLASVPNPDPTRRRVDLAIDTDELPSPVRAVDDPPVTAPLREAEPGHFIAVHSVGGAY